MKYIYYWSPCLYKVGTYKSTIHSMISLSKFSNKIFKIKLINVCGEWDQEKEMLLNNNIELLDLVKFKYFKYLPKNGFIKSRLSNIFIILFSFIPLINLLLKKKPDFFVVHLITSLPIILISILNLKINLILRISGFPNMNFFRKNLWTLSSNKIYKITCPSKDLMKQLISLKIFPESKLKFLPDPIIKTENFLKRDFNKIEKKKSYNIDKKFFIAAGRFTKQKNFGYLIDEFSEFAKNNFSHNLVIFGEGEEKEKLIANIKKYGLENRIFLPGYTDNIYFYMKKADAYILSSIWEDPGFVLIEAAMCNLFIISSNCKNGPTEFLYNGKAGILYESNKKGALKDSLNQFFSIDKQKKEMILKAKKNCLKYTLLRHNNIFKDIIMPS